VPEFLQKVARFIENNTQETMVNESEELRGHESI
jgi:hypothetical protein